MTDNKKFWECANTDCKRKDNEGKDMKVLISGKCFFCGMKSLGNDVEEIK